MGETGPSFFQYFGFAGLSAALAESATFPMDTTKTRMQIQIFSRGSSTRTAHYRTVAHFGDQFIRPKVPKKKIVQNPDRGMIDTAKRILQKEGMAGFYKGVSPAVFRAIVNSSVSMTAYRPLLHVMNGGSVADALQRKFPTLNEDKRHIGLVPKIVAGAISGAFAQIFGCPMDVVKVRLQADGHLRKPRYTGAVHAFWTIVQKHGFLKLWTGLWPSLQRSALSVSCSIASYDHSKQYFIWKHGWRDSITTHVAASAISSFCATLFSCPFDVVKTRLQFQSMTTPKYRSVGHCLSKTVRKEGIRALFRGCLPIYMRLGPWQMVFFCSYEQISHFFTGTTF
eukprot:6701_1